MEGKKRLEQILNVYENLEKVLDSLPEQIPTAIRNTIKDSILNDKELKELMDNIKNRRPPRYLLIGNTGHGKSSLINAILGYYNSHVSAVKIGTTKNEQYSVKDENGETVFSVLDSRGINESTPETEKQSAEDQLLAEMSNFTPDAVIYVHKAKERSSMGAEIKFLKEINEKYYQRNHRQLPIIAVLSQCDELDPASKKEPNTYNQRKYENIELARQEASKIIREYGLDVKDVIVLSALMEYEQSYEELEDMSLMQRKSIQPELDGRYNIELFKQVLIDSIKDLRAQMDAAVNFRINKVLKSLARKFTHIFASIAGTIAITPIPASDVFILCALEAVLIMIISALSGREVSFKAAGELVVSFGGVGAVGFALRISSQQLSKLLNGLFPGSGSAVSSGIAVAGVETIGNSAIAYYFSDEE